MRRYNSKPMPVNAIVFDFDGTLVDASDAIISSMFDVLSQHGLPLPEETRIRASIGRPLTEMFAAADPEASPQRLQQYAKEYRGFFFPRSAVLTRPMPGAPEVLRGLSKRCRFAIATTRKADGAVHILKALGMLDLFESIVGLDEVMRPKPDPEPVLLALRNLGIAPSAAMMVGDTIDDVAAGCGAGTLSVGVTTGAHGAERLREAGAHHVIASLHELEALA